jgi:taurine dioxygenase
MTKTDTNELVELDLELATPTIGAYVRGISLAETQPTEVIEALRAAVNKYGVLFFRDQQDLTLDRQLEFGAQFGPPWVHWTADKEADKSNVMGFQSAGKPTVIGWHSDGTYDELPPWGSILRCIETPVNGGGDTLWVSLSAAYEALSPAMRSFLDGLHAEHDAGKGVRTAVALAYSDAADLVEKATLAGGTTHPLVITEPSTGRRHLFTNPVYLTRIVELSLDESDALLKFLFEHCKLPEFSVRLRWDTGTVAFWSNITTHHYPIADYHGHARKMERVTVRADARPA